MWGWLGSLSQQSANAAFPYTVGEERSSLSDKSFWKLHDGQKQADSSRVSIFVFEKAGASEDQVKLARSSFFRLKTLRHPNILRYIDGVELDAKICVVTEAVVPLQDYLAQNGDNKAILRLAISWGIHQVAKGISFLNMDCNLCHAALCMAAVFVDVGGEWKIGGVDYLHTIGEAQPGPMIEYLAKYRPPGGRVSDGKVKWATDVWGLGCLVWEVFNHPLPQLSALKTVSQIPKQLVPSYCELVSANARSRPSAATFIANCRKPSGFMNNDFVNINLQLEEIQILDAGEKEALFTQLTDCIDTFPEAFQRNKILPILLQAFEFGEAGAAVLAPLFKLGKLLDTEEYQSKIVPCVVKLFSSTDRGTRINLLQQLDLFIEHLQPSIVNEKIFPHVALGFNDTVPVMREHTIKSMLLLAPKLYEKTMNGELLRYFAKLQMDEQPGIRTNTTICLGKLAQYLNSSTRLKVLHSAFTRGLKDPFPPARLASLRGMMVCSEYFADQDLATRLLPALCVLMVDKEKPVRDAAFEASAAFIMKLEDASAKRALSVGDDTPGADGSTASSSLAAAGSAASWAGWAVTSLTSKIYKPDGTAMDASSAAAVSAMTSTAQSKPPQPVAAGVSRPGAAAAAAGSSSNLSSATTRSARTQAEASDVAGSDDGDGWGDDDDGNWESIEDSFAPVPVSKSAAPATAATKTTPAKSAVTKGDTGNDAGAWDDDEWGSFGGSFDSPAAGSKKPAASTATSTKGTSTKNSSTLAQKRSSGQPSSGSAASASATPASASAGVNDDGWGDGGGGWGGDDDDADWGTALETTSAKQASNLGASQAKKESSSLATSSKAKKSAMSLKSSKPASAGRNLDGFIKDDSMPTAASLFADSSSSKTSVSASSKPAATTSAKSTTTTTTSSSSSARAPSPTFAAAAESANDGDGWGDTDDWGDHDEQSTAAASSSAAKPASSTATVAEKNAIREQRRTEQRKRQEAAKAKRAAAAGGAKLSKIGGAMKLG